jgi:hypothetical protein
LVPPPYRNLQKRIPLTVQKHAYKLWSKGRALVLPTKDIPQADLSLLNYSFSHWTSKPGEPAGRWLIDCLGLNSSWAKEKAITRYGKVEIPTIEEICACMIAFCTHRNIPLDQCLISKDDVTSTCPSWITLPTPQCSSRCQLLRSWCCVHLVGNFGWTSFSMVFAVLGHALRRLIRPRLQEFRSCD